MFRSSDYGTAFDGRAVYQIIVLGTIPSYWSGHLEEMAIDHSTLEDGNPATILIGELIDQTALTSVLITLSELQLPIIAVERKTLNKGQGQEGSPEGEE